MMFTLLLLWLTQAQAACPEPTRADAVLRSLSTAEVAFAAMNESEFAAAVNQARAALTCLAEPLAPPDAAQMHRVEAYSAFLAGDAERTRLHFAAALSREPSYSLARSLAPEGHPLRAAFEDARQAPPAQLAPLAAPAEGSLLVDGARAADYPLNRPFILQLQAADGSITWTAQLAAGQALPDYPRGRRGAQEPNGQVVVLQVQDRPWALVGGAALGALTAGVLYRAAAGAEERFLDPSGCTVDPEPCYQEDLRALRVNHGLVLGSAALGVTAVGLGVTAVVRW